MVSSVPCSLRFRWRSIGGDLGGGLALFPRWLFWPLFWAIMGFAAGGSFVSATSKPIYQIAHSAKEQAAANSPSEREPDETGWHWLTHEAVRILTFWLVIVAIGQLALFFWQLVLIRESLDDAKIAADAAKCPSGEFLNQANQL